MTRRISKYFQLEKTQAELDFVDVYVDRDVPLFVDPFAISQRVDRWSQSCHECLVTYFERIIAAIRDSNASAALDLLRHLREPNETRLGLSSGRPQGAGIGEHQAEELLAALSSSTAVKTGFVTSLEECELMVEGIGRDKISDLTTNVIRHLLVRYTQDQCDLHSIALTQVPLPPVFDSSSGKWVSSYHDLPVAAGRPLLLVPKALVRGSPAYEHSAYYRHFVLEYLRAENLNAGSSLVHLLKNGKRVVYKKDLEEEYPLTKQFLFEFSRSHPEVLGKYRERLAELEAKGLTLEENEDEGLIAEALLRALEALPVGADAASQFHRLMVGVLEFVFFPDLLNPRKEKEIHQGRKRIDIVMDNGAHSGVFWSMHAVRKVPCAYVLIECKNYGKEIGNPELDQLAGRFSTNRSKVGFLCYRQLSNRSLLVERCRDTFRDDRGLILPIDDALVMRLLELVGRGARQSVNREIEKLVDEVVLA
jgi:hypothetical protein